jgi:putative pyruvate formate lyase activating enzyme
MPKLIPIIKKAKKLGLNLPFIMNCSGYETEEMISSLNGIIDIYIPDFKYMSPLLAKKYSNAPDYPSVAKKAIDLMIKQQEKCVFNENGILEKGVIVRHMVIPQNIHDSKKVLSYLHSSYGDNIYISIMSQYTPTKVHKFEELNRKVTSDEYDEVVDFALSIGIKNSYIQEREAADENFIPDFSEKSII